MIEKLLKIGIQKKPGYFYFVDDDGDVCSTIITTKTYKAGKRQYDENVKFLTTLLLGQLEKSKIEPVPVKEAEPIVEQKEPDPQQEVVEVVQETPKEDHEASLKEAVHMVIIEEKKDDEFEHNMLPFAEKKEEMLEVPVPPPSMMADIPPIKPYEDMVSELQKQTDKPKESQTQNSSKRPKIYYVDAIKL